MDEGAAAREMEVEKAIEVEEEKARERGKSPAMGKESEQVPLLRSRKGMGIGQA